METHLAAAMRATPAGQEADAILRSCVHCGFCTATCPTYRLLGDELDGPRGRIYLIKAVLEGNRPSASTRLHLDRCLSCRACETTCPSGVVFHRLLDIGRAAVVHQAPRPRLDVLVRRLLGAVLPRRRLFAAAFALARLAQGLLPAVLADRIHAPNRGSDAWPQRRHERRMLLAKGCVQPALEPNIDRAAARVLDRLGIELIVAPRAGCCGAMRHHLDAQQAALADARRNIDAWAPFLAQGVEAIVTTASGCGAHLKDYGQLLRHDAAYAAPAARIAALTKDIGEIVGAEQAALLALLPAAPPPAARVAFHSPCTLQHGLGIRGIVEDLLSAAGFELTPVADAHLCCGSAGTYSILQPALSRRLRDAKLAALTQGAPDLIATANIGCLGQLKSGGDLPVRHWIELLDQRLAAATVAA